MGDVGGGEGTLEVGAVTPVGRDGGGVVEGEEEEDEEDEEEEQSPDRRDRAASFLSSRLAFLFFLLASLFFCLANLFFMAIFTVSSCKRAPRINFRFCGVKFSLVASILKSTSLLCLFLISACNFRS